jgi:2-polyprenyl-3-methyl-5-hydroxy-6-metoxy-1,4-benzoquinol methylase
MSQTTLPRIEDQTRFWNDWIAQFREGQQLDEASARRGAKVLEWMMAVGVCRPRILELGCANGWLSEKLANFGPVTGIDLADEVIARARVNRPSIDFRAGDFLQMEVEEQSYDVVVCLETISYVADQPKFVAAIARNLRIGGYLMLTSVNPFVFHRLSRVAPKASGQIRNWVGRRDLKQLLRPWFSVSRLETMVPAGDRGVLRLVNSCKLNSFLGQVVRRAHLERLKERLGLGQTVAVLAKRTN